MHLTLSENKIINELNETFLEASVNKSIVAKDFGVKLVSFETGFIVKFSLSILLLQLSSFL